METTYYKKIDNLNTITHFYELKSDGERALALEYDNLEGTMRVIQEGESLHSVFEIDKIEASALLQRWAQKFVSSDFSEIDFEVDFSEIECSADFGENEDQSVDCLYDG